MGIINAGYIEVALSVVDPRWKRYQLAWALPLIVETMILRNVSILTSSEPFSSPDLSSCTLGYSVPLSNTIVWQEGSDEDIADVDSNKI